MRDHTGQTASRRRDAAGPRQFPPEPESEPWSGAECPECPEWCGAELALEGTDGDGAAAFGGTCADGAAAGRGVAGAAGPAAAWDGA